MKIINSYNLPKKFKSCVLAIGNFDGCHKGHQKVFFEAKRYAKSKKLKFGILTFSPMPVMFFNKKIKNFRLVSNVEKYSLLKKYGLDFVLNVNFNNNFSRMPANDFIKKILYKKINPKFIFVSSNFKFGSKRKGNVFLLKKYSSKYKYELKKTIPVKFKQKIISSTYIRSLLENGNVLLANKLLTRNWSISGNVKKGKSIGKKLGFPTCNIFIQDYLIPKIGVYAIKAKELGKNKVFSGVANLGFRPTFGGKKIILEVNLFNIRRNFYNKNLKIYFVRYIRGEKKFKNSINLVKQINKDVIIAKKHLKGKLVL